jgi:hypothetical protein
LKFSSKKCLIFFLTKNEMLSDSAELPFQNRVTGRLQKKKKKKIRQNLKSGQIICQAIKCLKIIYMEAQFENPTSTHQTTFEIF